MPIPRRPFSSAHDRAVAQDAPVTRESGAALTKNLQEEGLAFLADGVSLKTKPVMRLYEMLSTLPVRELRESLQTYHIADGFKGAKKAELITFLCALIVSPDNDYLRFVAGYGRRFVVGFRHIVESGGRLDIPKDQLTDFDQLITPAFPLLQLFFWQDTYTYVIPQELLPRFADADWDAVVALAEAMDRAVSYLERAVELWGVVCFEDVIDDAVVYAQGDVRREEVVTALMQGSSSELEPVMMDEPYLVHRDLAWFVHEDADSYDYGMEELRTLLDEREQYAPRPLTTEMIEADSLAAWLAKEESAQEFLALLDAQLSAGEDTSMLVDAIFKKAVRDAHDPVGQSGLFRLLHEADLAFPEQQLDYLIGLHAAVAAHVPLWYAYGWSLIELETGEAERENDGDVVAFRPARSAASPEANDGVTHEAEVLRFIAEMDDDLDDDDFDDGDDFGFLSDLDYDEYERRCDELEKENEQYLDEFEEWLRASGLKPKTISNHMGNVDFFLNNYLQYYEAIPMQEGPQHLDDFLGDWFIRKAMWSTPTTIQQTAASLKKFYKCMCERGHVSAEGLAEVLDTVKENLPDWKDACEDYNSSGTSHWF